MEPIAKNDVIIKDLTINYMKNPLGIETNGISFSWKMESKAAGLEQEAYQIKVYDSSEKIVWDSEKVETFVSVAIPYEGPELSMAARYKVKVTVFANDGNVYESSKESFETGVTQDEIWKKTPWIALCTKTDTPPIFRKEYLLKEEKPIVSARLYITAIGVYKAYINGFTVGKTDHMTPGYGDGDRSVSYQTYDVTEFIKERELAIAVVTGTGWMDENGADVMGSTENRVGVKAMLVAEYEDGSKEQICTDDITWKASLKGGIVKSGIFYGEDYDARREQLLGNYKKYGYEYDDFTADIKLTSFYYTGNLIADPAAVGKFVEEFNKTPDTIVIYDGVKEKSDYVGGEINAVQTYKKLSPEDKLCKNGISLKTGETMIVNFGQNMTAVPRIIMRGEEGKKVTLRFGEMLNDGSKITEEFISGTHDASGPKGSLYTHSIRTARCTATYVFAGNDKEEYQTLTSFFGYQYMEVTAECDLIIYEMEAKAISSVTKQTGWIETDNEDVNRLFLNTLYGQMSNYFTMITDCPQRDERKGWTGDAQVFTQTALYNFDALAFHISYQNKLRASVGQKGYAAAVLSLWDLFGNWASGWSDVTIINTYMMYRQTGDISLLKNNWDCMNQYMDYLKAHERSSYQAPNQDSTGYGDWLAFQGTGYEVIADYNYGYVTKMMVEIAEILGDVEKENYYKEYFSCLKKEFLKEHVTYEDGELVIHSSRGSHVMQDKGGVLEDNSQTSLLWMLKLGYYEDERMHEEAIRLLIANIRNESPKKGSIRAKYGKNSLAVGFIGVNTIAPVLTEEGYSNIAYDLLLNAECPSWLYEVKQGATTIWERWNSYHQEEGFGDSEMNSFNHFSYGSVVEWMYRYMAGIATDISKPGFRHMILQPALDTGSSYNEEKRINHVRGVYESYYGRIESMWSAKEGKLTEYTVSIPANTVATLYLPIDGKIGDMDINSGLISYQGIQIWNGITTMKFQLKSGRYQFKVEADTVSIC